jgi:hypothetical protein
MSEIDYGDVSQVAKATNDILKRWRRAYLAMRKASTARAKLDGSATRARLTTANARYARAAEDFDRIDGHLREWAECVDPIEIEALEKWKRENL